jgi:hypothetical protein
MRLGFLDGERHTTDTQCPRPGLGHQDLGARGVDIALAHQAAAKQPRIRRRNVLE